MALEDLHNQFLAFTNPEPDATPDIDTVMQGVTKVYNDDLAVRDEVIKNRDEALAERDKTISELKQKNYDLLVKQPATKVANESGNNNSDTEPDESERAATITINDLFEGRK